MKSAVRSAQHYSFRGPSLGVKFNSSEPIYMESQKRNSPSIQRFNSDIAPLVDKNQPTSTFGFGIQVTKIYTLQKEKHLVRQVPYVTPLRKVAVVRPSANDQSYIKKDEARDQGSQDIRAKRHVKLPGLSRASIIQSGAQSSNVSFQSRRESNVRLEKISGGNRFSSQERYDNSSQSTSMQYIEKRGSVEIKDEETVEPKDMGPEEGKTFHIVQRKLIQRQDSLLDRREPRIQRIDPGINLYLKKALDEISSNIKNEVFVNVGKLSPRTGGGLEVMGQVKGKEKFEEKFTRTMSKEVKECSTEREQVLIPKKQPSFKYLKYLEVRRSTEQSERSIKERSKVSGSPDFELLHQSEIIRTEYGEKQSASEIKDLQRTADQINSSLNVNNNVSIGEQREVKKFRRASEGIEDETLVLVRRESSRARKRKEEEEKDENGRDQPQTKTARHLMEILEFQSINKRVLEKQAREAADGKNQAHDREPKQVRSRKESKEALSATGTSRKAPIEMLRNIRESKRKEKPEVVIKENDGTATQDSWVAAQSDEEDHSLDDYLKSKQTNRVSENLDHDFIKGLVHT